MSKLAACCSSSVERRNRPIKRKMKIIKRKSKFLDVDEIKSVQRVGTNFGKRDFLNENQVVELQKAS
jgi:hypothetical protein